MLHDLRRIISVASRWTGLQTQLARRRYRLDMARSRLDVPQPLVEDFLRCRESPDYRRVFDEQNPLVSVCVGTYNRRQLLVSRALRSLVEQTYENIEIVVVGDHCTDDTAAAIDSMGDPRIRFVNLPVRGAYPDDPRLRWMVAGTAPINHALELARGRFITHLDDDDEHDRTRIQTLLTFIQETGADLVYHPFHFERQAERWSLNSANDFRYSQVTTSSVFYHHWFRRIPWDAKAYLCHEPGDWNRLRKIRHLGATCRRHPQPLLRHYVERSQWKR